MPVTPLLNPHGGQRLSKLGSQEVPPLLESLIKEPPNQYILIEK